MATDTCWAEIDTRALKNNYRYLCSLAPSGAECMAVVKADAYGHGLALCAPAAVSAGAQWLAVATMPEALQARAIASGSSEEARILAIGGVLPGWGAEAIGSRITPSVWTLEQLDELEIAARAAGLRSGAFPVHLEIDTGMSRQGVGLDSNRDELARILARFKESSPLYVEAVMTHLYASDESDGERSARQFERLEEALGMVRSVPECAARLEYLSAGASAALMGADAEAVAALAQKFELRPMFRLGLALYGIAPCSACSADSEAPKAQLPGRLAPVLAWKTRVVSLREISAGTEIGYNGTFVATEPMRLALISAGYADGLDRRLGNRFGLLVRGERAPIVGRVSMDVAVLDVTEIAGVETGDEVVILGTQDGESISAWELAEASETVPWEVLTGIGARVPRMNVQLKSSA